MQTNNKLREALKHIQNLADALDLNEPNVIAILDTCRDALAEQVKNCDVGTAEEQVERWGTFCNRYDDDCTGCPCDAAYTGTYTQCFSQWAQMPYKKGGNDGNE